MRKAVTRALAALLVALFTVGGLAQAQTTNLLRNGGLEEGSFGPYSGRRSGTYPIYLPEGWAHWFAAQNGDYYNRGDLTSIRPHPGPGPTVKEGGRALNIDCGFVTCTTAIYQQVSGVENGKPVQASAYAQVKACNLPRNANGNIIGDNCGSAIESGSQTRIGIDPNGGTDPNDIDVVWSAYKAPHEQGGWQQMTVSATATSTTVTLFLYSTQANFADINKVYWDDAVLSAGGAGGANPGAATAVPTAPPFVAFVVPQGTQEDGSIVHVVQSGDTIDSIAYAYGVSRSTIMELNNIIDPRIISLGQRLIIKPPEGEPTEAPTPEPAATAGEVVIGANPDAGSVEVVPEATAEAAAPTPEPQPTEPPPTAPVVVADAGALDPAATTGSVCVTLFNDADQNRIQEQGETLLAGGAISVLQGSDAAGSYETDGVSEPHCFEGLTAGDYVAAAVAPDGYGLTTPDQLRVRLNPGASINITFGAAEGVQPVPPPPADAGALTEEVAETPQDSSPGDQLLGISGLIIFGLAAVILAGGVGVALFMRRR